ncbi:F-box only protein [Ooceraea biroi]|uniref:F-box only protein n=1 Tax=Ooceraea biroi TaxID=2015173 RepID=A0A026WAM9_OOCBI|nr:F-box only protein [Ooceraea biroi]
MATISNLPEEMIKFILCNNSINIQDIFNFCTTCKNFNTILEDNVFWKRKFYLRWPRLKTINEKEICTQKGYVDFRKAVETRVKCGKKLRFFLTQINKKYYRRRNGTILSSPINIDEKGLNLLMNPNEMNSLNSYFLIDEVTSLLERSERKHKDDLPNSYYTCKKLLPHLRHYYQRNIWQEFSKRPAEQQLLEEAATFVAQWYQPRKDILYSDIDTKLNNIVQEVLVHLKLKNPKHPIFLASPEQFLFWKNNYINENQWENHDARQILNTLCQIFLSKLNFRRIVYSEETNIRRKYFINYVLEEKVGDSLLLTIVFQSVVRRLGICCDLIIPFADDFLAVVETQCFLTWQPKYNVTNPEYFDINILHNEVRLSKCDRPRTSLEEALYITRYGVYNTFGKINSAQLIELINWRIVHKFSSMNLAHKDNRYSLELLYLIKPCNMNTLMQLSFYYLQRRMSQRPIITAIKKITALNPQPRVASKGH